MWPFCCVARGSWPMPIALVCSNLKGMGQRNSTGDLNASTFLTGHDRMIRCNNNPHVTTRQKRVNHAQARYKGASTKVS